MSTTSGHCLCGAVAFSYEGAPNWTLHRGSPLTYENERAPDEIHLLAGALGDPERVRATAHVFAGEQLSWFDAADELPRYETTRRNARPIRRGPRK